MQREKFGSRLGFILISAGCAIGLGNVYRFPIITGAYGGAAFVLIYVVFLLLLGLPVMVAELSVGRGSQKSIASSFEVLQKPTQKWGFMKYIGIAGNYLLMMMYTLISGWMLLYFVKYVSGSMSTVSGTKALSEVFASVSQNTATNILATYVVIILCFSICALGLQKGVERVTKVMMIALFVLLMGLAIYSCTLSNAAQGLKFYLVPDFAGMKEAGIMTVVSAAMGQAFFTLSLGIGSIAIFGSYIGKDRKLTGEAVTIISLDTFVALMSGLVVFPAYFTYNGATLTAKDAGPGFLFTTLTTIFNEMKGGQLIGALFFLFMMFASLSTVIAVFENIVSLWFDKTKLSRKVICLINIGLLLVLSLPCIFSQSIWADIKVLGLNFMDLEDAIVSKVLLPVGSLGYVLFCTSRYGWGWDNFISEANQGKGMAVPKWVKPYMSYVLPLAILLILVMSFI